MAGYVSEPSQRICYDLRLRGLPGYRSSSFIKGPGELPVSFRERDISPDIKGYRPRHEQCPRQTVETSLHRLVTSHAHQIQAVIGQCIGSQFL